MEHTGNSESPYVYIYHLSDEMKHGHAFMSAVVNHILELQGTPQIIHFKSDNCGAQHKCKWVFNFWHSLAIIKNCKVTICYGVAGHRKGLVDAMSAFGVKLPLMKAVMTQNFHNNSASDIYNYLQDLFKNDPMKHHFLLSPEEINHYQNNKSPLPIDGCKKITG